MFLKLDDDTKSMLEEISAISGIQRDVVREVWEFTLIRWVEKLTKDPKKLTTLTVPFLGQVGIRYVEDILKEDGTIDTKADAYLALSPTFKTLVGDVYDEKLDVIIAILQKKIDNALITALDKNNN